MSTGEPRTAIAVVSDGSAGPDDSHAGPGAHPNDRLRQLSSIAALLHERVNVDAEVILLDTDGTEDFLAQLQGLSANFTVLYLVDITWARAQAAQRALGRMSVITDWQTSAIALTAALLTTLTRLRRPRNVSTVLIVGRDHHPEIAALAAAAGVSNITSWTPRDAPGYRLSALARTATAIIDVVNSSTIRAQLTQMVLPPPIITLEHPEHSLLALAELLLVRRGPGSSPDTQLSFTCARELSARTPHDRLLPRLGHCFPPLPEPAQDLRPRTQRQV
jgi:malate dehydrogenase (oxaloacetate-decarboxylating)